MNDEVKAEEAPSQADDQPAKDPVRSATRGLVLFALVLIVWYLVADRFTPSTSQARVHAFVIPVAAEVSGTVEAVSVANNQRVNEGDELFRLDRANYELAVTNADAGLQTARQGTGASTANVEGARSSVGAAEAGLLKAQQDLDRLRRIKEEDPGAISDRRLEAAQASFAIAQEQLAGARATLLKAEEDLGEVGDDNSRVRQALAALEQAKVNLGRTIVRAPADGLVTDVRVDRGNFAAAGKPQMIFIASDDAWVQADFTENNLGHVDVGDSVEMTFDVFPGRIFSGQVRSAGYGVSVDSAPLGSLPTIKNDREWLRDAQRFPVEVEFDMPDRDDRSRLRVGAQVTVIIYADEEWLINSIGKLQIRLSSLLSYAY